jgi:hypothetical protein
MSEVNFTDICTAYVEALSVYGSFEAYDNNMLLRTHVSTEKMMCLLFSTYPDNVPAPVEYTVEDMLRLANDPAMLDKYETPFCITALYHQNRPALYVTPHAGLELANMMDCPTEYDHKTVVVRASLEEQPVALNILEVMANCAMPEKYTYGCDKCLRLNKHMPGTCPVRRAVGADNLAYGAKSIDTEPEERHYYTNPLSPQDPRIIKSYGKVNSPFASRKTMMAGHLYVSPTMLYVSNTDTHYRRNRSDAFVSLRSITVDDIDFTSYKDHLETKQTAIQTRKEHRANIKKNCTQCSMKEICHRHFNHKKNYCSSPLPPVEEIDKFFLAEGIDKMTKETLVDILLASGSAEVTNQATGRKCDGYITLHNDMHGMGYRVTSRTTGRILAWGVTPEAWETFKKDNNINTAYSDYARNELIEFVNNPAHYAKLLACAAIKCSPRLQSGFNSTEYDKAFVQVTWNTVAIKFRWNSKRRVCPWDYEVGDWEDLFKHYGHIPGFR